jgi:hypothetical protein
MWPVGWHHVVVVGKIRIHVLAVVDGVVASAIFAALMAWRRPLWADAHSLWSRYSNNKLITLIVWGAFAAWLGGTLIMLAWEAVSDFREGQSDAAPSGGASARGSRDLGRGAGAVWPSGVDSSSSARGTNSGRRDRGGRRSVLAAASGRGLDESWSDALAGYSAHTARAGRSSGPGSASSERGAGRMPDGYSGRGNRGQQPTSAAPSSGGSARDWWTT